MRVTTELESKLVETICNLPEEVLPADRFYKIAEAYYKRITRRQKRILEITNIEKEIYEKKH